MIDPGEQPTIRTNRLFLTPFVADDAPAVFAYASDPSVSRYTTWTTHRSVSDARGFIRMVQAYRSGFCWAIRLSEGGAARGAIEFTFDDRETGQVHFVLAAGLWNRGIMTEAVAGVLGWAFDSFEHLREVVTGAVVANVGSRRVMEKNGFRLDGFVDEEWEKSDEPVEVAKYVLDRATWARRSG